MSEDQPLATRWGAHEPIGDSVNECTESSTPERVRNVPRIVSENVASSSERFQMRSIPLTNNLAENAWIWQPRGNRLWISWGTGLGGFRGTLTQYSTGEFVGKIKEWCDSHCEWKRRVAKIRIQRTDCPE